MTAAKKPGGTDPDLMLIIGQVLEATRATSENLKTLNAEVRSNAVAVQRVEMAVEQVSQLATQLRLAVSSPANPNNLEVTVRDLRASLVAIDKAGEACARGNAALAARVAALEDAPETTPVRVTEMALRLDRTEQKLDKADQKLLAVEHRLAKSSGARSTLVVVVAVLAWLVTTGVALYAAVGQWHAGK